MPRAQGTADTQELVSGTVCPVPLGMLSHPRAALGCAGHTNRAVSTCQWPPPLSLPLKSCSFVLCRHGNVFLSELCVLQLVVLVI